MSALLARCLTVVTLLTVGSAALAGPRAELWPRWQARDDASDLRVDHGRWDRLLKEHVRRGEDGINRVDYGGFDAADRASLRTYIQSIAGLPVARYNAREQMSLWLNLYNALTVNVVLEHYPVRSIRDIDISPGLFADGPWGKKLVTVEGEALSLDDIEHRILRPIWRDPRIHYAVNCAALGCPNLQPRAFQPQTLERQLDAAARAFVNHPRGVRLDGGELQVSSIYSWFKEDFGDSDVAVIEHLRRFADDDLRRSLQGANDIADHDYDWSINSASSR